MSKQRRYTAQEMREQADHEEQNEGCVGTVEMLRQAADAEEENAHLREERNRLAAMVERCEELHAKPYGISDDDYNYILKGATDGTKH